MGRVLGNEISLDRYLMAGMETEANGSVSLLCDYCTVYRVTQLIILGIEVAVSTQTNVLTFIVLQNIKINQQQLLQGSTMYYVNNLLLYFA